MDDRGRGGDGGRSRRKRGRRSANNGGNEPRKGSTSPVATHDPSIVIDLEKEPQPSRFTLYNYNPPPSSPPLRPSHGPPPIRLTPLCPPPLPPPLTPTPSYPSPRPPSVTTWLSLPTNPIQERLLPPPGFSIAAPSPPAPTLLTLFPQREVQPQRLPSPTLGPRPCIPAPSAVSVALTLGLNPSGSETPSHAKPDPPNRNRPIIIKRKRSSPGKDGNDEKGAPSVSSIIIRDQQPPSGDRSREAQQGNPDAPDLDEDDSLSRVNID